MLLPEPSRRASIGPKTTPSRAVAALTGLVLLALGCLSCADDDNDACRTGDDPMAVLRISTADCPNAECWRTDQGFYELFLSGDATVTALVSTTPGEYQFDLRFVEDATTVSFTAFLPVDIPLPLVEGDVVDGTVSIMYEGDWSNSTTSASAQIRDNDGILLSMSLGDFSVDPLPPPCEGSLIGYGCGPIGYPYLTFCHPDHLEDPMAPCADLRQGYSADLVWNGRAYSVYVLRAYVLVPPGQCTETPPGYRSTTRVRRLDLEGL